MSQKDYIIFCIGYERKRKKEEALERSLQYSIVKGWADPKTLPGIHAWWPIQGEVIPTVKAPSKAKLLKIENLFRNIGIKNGRT
jgi:hypothetical protein